jgi:threonine aldolase
LTPEYTRAVRALADEFGLKVHLDGARVWNAAAALGVDVRALTGPVDTVSFCISKGLCAPVGSLLCGDRVFIDRARRIRKMLGGGMRQAGVLAAAGIIAVEQMTTRLGEDHRNARRLAEGLVAIPGLVVDLNQVQTNMVFVTLDDSIPLDTGQVYDLLDHEFDVRLSILSPRQFRAVTHYWITPERVDRAIEAIREVVARIREDAQEGVRA